MAATGLEGTRPERMEGLGNIKALVSKYIIIHGFFLCLFLFRYNL